MSQVLTDIQESTSQLQNMSPTLQHGPFGHSYIYIFSVSKPNKFDGNPERCSVFLLLCFVFINNSAPTTDQAKDAFIVSCLSNKALEWTTEGWSCLSHIPMIDSSKNSKSCLTTRSE